MAGYRTTKTIPTAGRLNARFACNTEDECGLPVKVTTITSIDPIPDDCDLAIVSGLYASLSTDLRIRTVADPVYYAGKVVGCLRIGRVDKARSL